MENVTEFVTWALNRAKRASVPTDAILPIPLSQVGSDGEWEYLFGTTGRICTQDLLDRKYKNPYKGWDWSRVSYDAATKGWVERKQIVCDCQGLLDHYMKCDTNAKDNYKNYCTGKGLVKKITRAYVLGEAVFNGSTEATISHVGWICGFMPDGEPLVIQEKGLSYGCVVTLLSSGGSSGKAWKYRGLMTKKFAYDSVQESMPVVVPTIPISSPVTILKEPTYVSTPISRLLYNTNSDMPKIVVKVRGANMDFMRGNDVKALQYKLGIRGCELDGVFGGDTEKALVAYQKKNKLVVDGICGADTCKKLGLVWSKA